MARFAIFGDSCVRRLNFHCVDKDRIVIPSQNFCNKDWFNTGIMKVINNSPQIPLNISSGVESGVILFPSEIDDDYVGFFA